MNDNYADFSRLVRYVLGSLLMLQH